MVLLALTTFLQPVSAAEKKDESPRMRTAQFFSVSFGSKYTDDDFRRMAEKLDLLILDALNYPRPPAILKRTNPNIKVLGYRDCFDAKDLSQYAGRKLTPGGKTERMLREWQRADAADWFYHDEQGQRVKVYLNKADNRYGLDIGKPEVREYLAARTREIVDAGYDGVFLDNVGVRYPYGYGIVLVNIADTSRTVALPATYQTARGEKIECLQLPGRSGQILFTLDDGE